MFDPTLHPTMFSPLQVLGDLQQCLSQPYPSKKSGVCLNHNNHVWQNKIKFIWCWQSRANTRNGFWPACIEAKICLPSISCLCKLLILKADDVPAKYYFRFQWFHQSPPECQHTWAEYKCPLPSMVVHPCRGTWSSFRHWHVWGAADDDEKLDGHSINAWEWMVWNRLECHESLSLEILRALMMYPYFAHSPLVWMKSSTLPWVQETGIPSLKVHWTTPIIIERFYLDLG